MAYRLGQNWFHANHHTSLAGSGVDFSCSGCEPLIGSCKHVNKLLLSIHRRDSKPTITALAKANSNLTGGQVGSLGLPVQANHPLSSDRILFAWITMHPTTVLLLHVYWLLWEHVYEVTA
jgi:hypothetical protein